MKGRLLSYAGALALAAASLAGADVVEVTGFQANVRKGASRTAEVIVLVPRGGQFELIGRVGPWYHVKLATGETGFVHASLARVLHGAAAPAPRPEPPPGVPRTVPATPQPTPVQPAPAIPPPAETQPRRAAPSAPAPAPAPRTVPPPIEPIVSPSTQEALPRFAVGLHGGIHWLTAAPNTAKALFDGETSGFEGGGFATYGVTRNVFLTASGTFFQKKGERVFVLDPDGPIARLGHPLTLRLIPAHLSVGYRFEPWPSVVPYVSVGGGAVFFREESTIGGVTEKSSRTKGMGIATAGVDYVRSGLLVGVQASWSTVPKIVGRSGVSAVYGEDDLGGVSVSLRLGASF